MSLCVCVVCIAAHVPVRKNEQNNTYIVYGHSAAQEDEDETKP